MSVRRLSLRTRPPLGLSRMATVSGVRFQAGSWMWRTDGGRSGVCRKTDTEPQIRQHPKLVGTKCSLMQNPMYSYTPTDLPRKRTHVSCAAHTK